MKKFLSLFAALCLLVTLCACGGSGDDTPKDTTPANDPGAAQTETPAGNNNDNSGDTTPSEAPKDDTPSVPSGNGGPTDLDFASEVTALEGTWNLSQVHVDGETVDVAADAMSFKVALELDPSELVDGEAYIHNQVYNLTGVLTFGVDSIVAELEGDDIESYKGTTGWNDFPQGKVVEEGQFYEQPGPGLMRLKDIDEYGLYLDQIAGASADIDTTEKSLIIGMNASGQLLLGYSEEHIERPGTDGEWVYLLIFDKA